MKTIVLAERLQALQQAGFKIYTQTKGLFSELNTPSLMTPEKLFYSDALSDKSLIKQACQQLELSHDELLILNQAAINALLMDEDEWSELPSFKQMNLHQSNLSAASLIRLLTKKSTEIEQLNLAECINLQDATIPNHLTLSALQALILGSENTRVFISAINLDIPRINNLDVTSIQQLINSAPQLKELDLSNCEQIPLTILDHIKNPSLIEILRLKELKLNQRSLKKLLTAASGLKVLDLSNCPALDEDLLDNLTLESLEVLDLFYTHINKASFIKFLKKTPKLKRVGFSRFQESENNTLDIVNLAALEVLELTDSTISSASLEKLLKKNLNLKHLS